jgi:hypothetical protein
MPPSRDKLVTSRGYTPFPYVVCLLLIIGFPLLVLAPCPDCYWNQLPFDENHVTAEDGSGRRTIVIQIERLGQYGWGEQTNTRIWNGAQQAINDWNGACDDWGNRTAYYFKLDQNAEHPDFIIKKGATNSGCAEVFGSGPPYIILLPENTAVSFSDAEIAGKIKHEMGHKIGAAQTDSCASIMNSASVELS